MSDSDRLKWNEKYRAGSHTSNVPSPLVVELAQLLPDPKSATRRAIDVAGGAGRHALWLAGMGFSATLCDIADEAILLAAERARASQLSLACQRLDLESKPFPSGPWDVILTFHYLWRPLFPRLIAQMASDGVLVVVQPTVRNLERHTKPSAEFLLQENELPSLVAGLEIVFYDEGWLAEGRHEARLVARRAG